MIVPLLVRVEEHEDTSSLLWLLIELKSLPLSLTRRCSSRASVRRPIIFPRSPRSDSPQQIGSSYDLTRAKIPGVEMFSCSSIPMVALSKLWFFN